MVGVPSCGTLDIDGCGAAGEKMLECLGHDSSGAEAGGVGDAFVAVDFDEEGELAECFRG